MVHLLAVGIVKSAYSPAGISLPPNVTASLNLILVTALLELQSEIGGASGFNAPGGDNRGDGKRYIVHADQKLTAFFELESACGAASH